MWWQGYGQRLLGLVCGLLLGMATVGWGAEPLTIRADAWPPFNDQPGTIKSGYMIDVLWEIFAPAGYAIDYKLMSWDDSLAAVRKGKFDAVVGADKNDAPGFVFPKETFGRSGTSFFVKNDNPWRFLGPASLREVRLGVVEGYSYNPALDAYIKLHRKNGRVVTVDGEEPVTELLKLLLADKIDVIAEDGNVLLYGMVKLGFPPGKLVRAGSADDESPVYVAFSPANPKAKELAQKFDEGIQALRASGKLKAILSRYGLSDWSDKFPQERLAKK